MLLRGRLLLHALDGVLLGWCVSLLVDWLLLLPYLSRSLRGPSRLWLLLFRLRVTAYRPW